MIRMFSLFKKGDSDDDNDDSALRYEAPKESRVRARKANSRKPIHSNLKAKDMREHRGNKCFLRSDYNAKGQ